MGNRPTTPDNCKACGETCWIKIEHRDICASCSIKIKITVAVNDALDRIIAAIATHKETL